MEIINITFIFIILILCISLVSIMMYYIKLQKRAHLLEKEINKHYLKRARTEAHEIIEEAGQEALSMLDASHIVSEKDQAILESVVNKLTQDQSAFLKQATDKLLQEFNMQISQIKETNIQALSQTTKQLSESTALQTTEYNKAIEQSKLTSEHLIQQFEAQLQQLKDYNINILTNVSKDIESNTKTQIGEFTKQLEEETISSEKEVKTKINEEYKLVEKDIEAYKMEQLNKIDASLQGILQKLTANILQRTISTQEHKEIIMQTLEKAKNENMFVN